MKVAVWDTFVKQEIGWKHFDIILPTTVSEEGIVWSYGVEYLRDSGVESINGFAKKCSFCHVETPTEEMIESIQERGYFILELPDVVSVT